MKKIIAIIFLAASALITLNAQSTNQKTYFLYPTPPGNLENFYDRCNYMVKHFWDNCNMTSAFSSRERLKGAFIDYVNFCAHAHVDTTMASIGKLIKAVEKKPANLLTLGRIANAVLLSDTSEIYSEQLYYPFAKAVADCKKISSSDRAPFVRQARILGGTQEGMVAPDIEYVTADGKKGNLNSIQNKRIIILFDDPECGDCSLLKVRLSADYNLKQLYNKGYLQFVCIRPGAADDAWKEEAAGLPDTWIVGASPKVGDYYDLESKPAIYYLTPEHKILSKKLDKDRLLDVLRALNSGVK